MPIRNQRTFGGSISSDESGLQIVPDVDISIDEDFSPVRTNTIRLIFLWNTFVNWSISSSVEVSVGTLSDANGEGDIFSALLTLPTNAHGTLMVTVVSYSAESEAGVSGPRTSRVYTIDYDTRPQTVTNPNGSTLRTGSFVALGYSFEGCLEAIGVVYNSEAYIYAVYQTANYTSFVEASGPQIFDFEAQGVNKARQGQAKLYKIRVSTGTWTLLRDYEFVSTAARSLKEIDGTVYWFEGSHYCYYNEGNLERVSDPEADFYVDIGTLTRKTAAPGNGEWNASASTLNFSIARDDEMFASIKSALSQGNYLLIGRLRLKVSNIRLQVIGNRATFTMDYEIFSEGALPAIDEENTFRMNVATYKEVYSNYRLRRLYLVNASQQKNWKAEAGRLWSVLVSGGTPTHLGRCWTSAEISENPHRDKERPVYEDYDPVVDIDKFYGAHGGMASPLIWDGERLSFVAGYARLDQLTDNESEAARLPNWMWLQRSTEVNPRVVTLESNGRTTWDVLKAAALLTDSYVAIEGDRVDVKPRLSARGELEGALSATHTGELDLLQPTRETFPSSGLLRIDKELIAYGALSDGNPSSLTRGTEGTTAASHAQGAVAYWVDHIIEWDRYAVDPMDRIVIQNDEENIYNSVKVRFGDDVWPATDAASIAARGLLELPVIDVGLDATQKDTAKFLAERYLAELKRPRQVVNLTLKLSLYLEMMDVLLVREADRTHLDTLMQVIDIDDQIFRDVSVVKCVLL